MRYNFCRTCKALRAYGNRLKERNSGGIVKRENNVDNITRNVDYSVSMDNGTTSTVDFYIVHVYKIRIDDNSSLIVDPLGSWSPGTMLSLKLPVHV